MDEKNSGCPACGATAFYRYGRAVNGKKRRICLMCGRQYIVDSLGRYPSNRPLCPKCGEPMHLYRRQGSVTRYRCRNYPQCRSYVKVRMELRSA